MKPREAVQVPRDSVNGLSCSSWLILAVLEFLASGREEPNMARRRVNFPEQIAVRLSAGTSGRIKTAAARDGESPQDWMRGVLRKAIEASRKRAERSKPKPPPAKSHRHGTRKLPPARTRTSARRAPSRRRRPRSKGTCSDCGRTTLVTETQEGREGRTYGEGKRYDRRYAECALHSYDTVHRCQPCADLWAEESTRAAVKALLLSWLAGSRDYLVADGLRRAQCSDCGRRGMAWSHPDERRRGRDGKRRKVRRCNSCLELLKNSLKEDGFTPPTPWAPWGTSRRT